MIPVQSIAALLLGSAIGFDSWGFMMPQLNPADTLLLVNKQNKAPIIPISLILPETDPVEERYRVNTYMRPDAAKALEELFAGAEKDGIHLYSLSGFRSYATQKTIFSRKRQERGEKVANKSSAKPGYSEHHTGLAMDFEGESTIGKGLVAEIGESIEGIWVAEHCWEYGFILRYPKDKTDITGYIYEPWHVRFVGKKASAEIHEMGNITFEEYMLHLRAERINELKAEQNEKIF